MPVTLTEWVSFRAMCVDDIVRGVDDRVKGQGQFLRRRTARCRQLNTVHEVVEVVVPRVGFVDALRTAEKVNRSGLCLGKVLVRPFDVEDGRSGYGRVDASLKDAIAE